MAHNNINFKIVFRDREKYNMRTEPVNLRLGKKDKP